MEGCPWVGPSSCRNGAEQKPQPTLSLPRHVVVGGTGPPTPILWERTERPSPTPVQVPHSPM